MDYGVIDHGDDGEKIHFAPLFGPAHVCSEDCWCHPEPDSDLPDFVIHNVAH